MVTYIVVGVIIGLAAVALAVTAARAFGLEVPAVGPKIPRWVRDSF